MTTVANRNKKKEQTCIVHIVLIVYAICMTNNSQTLKPESTISKKKSVRICTVRHTHRCMPSCNWWWRWSYTCLLKWSHLINSILRLLCHIATLWRSFISFYFSSRLHRSFVRFFSFLCCSSCGTLDTHCTSIRPSFVTIFFSFICSFYCNQLQLAASSANAFTKIVLKWLCLKKKHLLSVRKDVMLRFVYATHSNVMSFTNLFFFFIFFSFLEKCVRVHSNNIITIIVIIINRTVAHNAKRIIVYLKCC